MGSAINQTVTLECNSVTISRNENGVVVIRMKMRGSSPTIFTEYEVVPKLDVKDKQATATTSLNDVTVQEDDIPF